MASVKTFSVKNFAKFQHYKDRAPPWIKLYNGLLEDYEFGGLPDASKMHLVAIWLLASRTGNKMPYDPKWVSGRINATEPVDLNLLVSRGFILLDQVVHEAEQVASKPPSECLTREEGQTQDIEKRKEEIPTPAKPQARSNEAFDRFKAAFPRRDGANPWQPAEKKFGALVKTGVDPEVMITAAAALAREEGARGNTGTKFIPQAITWLNQQRFQDVAAASFDGDELNWDAVLSDFKKSGRWSRFAGPDLESPACRAPKDLLEKYGLEARRMDA
jgi:hypothetical protein